VDTTKKAMDPSCRVNVCDTKVEKLSKIIRQKRKEKLSKNTRINANTKYRILKEDRLNYLLHGVVSFLRS